MTITDFHLNSVGMYEKALKFNSLKQAKRYFINQSNQYSKENDSSVDFVVGKTIYNLYVFYSCNRKDPRGLNNFMKNGFYFNIIEVDLNDNISAIDMNLRKFERLIAYHKVKRDNYIKVQELLE